MQEFLFRARRTDHKGDHEHEHECHEGEDISIGHSREVVGLFILNCHHVDKGDKAREAPESLEEIADDEHEHEDQHGQLGEARQARQSSAMLRAVVRSSGPDWLCPLQLPIADCPAAYSCGQRWMRARVSI